MAYLINENDPDDYTKDTFDTATGPFGVTGFSNDGKESGDYCYLCMSIMESSIHIETHLQGRKHINKVNQVCRKPKLIVESSTGVDDDPDNLFLHNYCKVCKADLATVDQAESHYLSDRHNKKVRNYFLIAVGAKPEPEKPQPEAGGFWKDKCIKSLGAMVYCSICEIEFTSDVVAESHYKGKRHYKKLKLLNMTGGS